MNIKFDFDKCAMLCYKEIEEKQYDMNKSIEWWSAVLKGIYDEAYIHGYSDGNNIDKEVKH